MGNIIDKINSKKWQKELIKQEYKNDMILFKANLKHITKLEKRKTEQRYE